MCSRWRSSDQGDVRVSQHEVQKRLGFGLRDRPASGRSVVLLEVMREVAIEQNAAAGFVVALVESLSRPST